MNLVTAAIMLLMLAWLIFTISYWTKRRQNKEIEDILGKGAGVAISDGPKMLFFEKKLFSNLHLHQNQLNIVLWAERILIIAVLIFCFINFGIITATIIAGVVIVLLLNDANKNVVEESGINNITFVTTFINTFVPNITSGSSGDQAMVVFINSLDPDSPDREMVEEWYDNRDDPTYVHPVRIREIVEIYYIVRTNEDQGMNDYIHILEELQRDYQQKQVYYTSFTSKIGEITPICWSYYIAIPLLIAMSYFETADFWWGIGGVICAVALVGMFLLFEFLIYKLRKNTIQNIF